MRAAAPGLSLPDVLWEGRRPEDIPPEALTGPVVIKPTHGSGVNRVVRNGALGPDDIAALNAALAKDFAYKHTEWGYENVPPRLLVERHFLDDPHPVEDLKFYTFGRRIEQVVRIIDPAWQRLGQVWRAGPVGAPILTDVQPVVCPVRSELAPLPIWDEAVDVARRLGGHFDHMRVDLLAAEGRLWFGELTVWNLGGTQSWFEFDCDAQSNRAWDLRRSAFFKQEPGTHLLERYQTRLRALLDASASKSPPIGPA